MRHLLMFTAAVAVAVGGAQASATNLLADPGFEDPASYTYDGAPFVGFWEGFNGGETSSSAHDTTMPNSGTGHSSLAIFVVNDNNGDNTFAGVFQSIDVVAGDTVSGGFWHMTPDSPTALGVASEFRIEWHDITGAEIGRATNDGVVPTNEYSLLEVLDAVAPAGATEARLVYAIQTFGGEPNEGNVGTVFLDDAYMTRIPEPTTALLALFGLVPMAMRRR